MKQTLEQEKGVIKFRMTNLVASPAKMALKLQELEERLEQMEKELQSLKVKNGKKTKKND